MTCYNCDKCERNQHISKLGEFIINFKIGNCKIKKSIWLCKWCMTKFGIKYKVINDFVEVEKPNFK